MNCSPPGSLVNGILQERILEWVAIPFSRGSSWPRDPTDVSYMWPALAGGFFTTSATWEAPLTSLTELTKWQKFEQRNQETQEETGFRSLKERLCLQDIWHYPLRHERIISPNPKCNPIYHRQRIFCLLENIRNLKNKTIKDSITGKNLFYRSFHARLFFMEK